MYACEEALQRIVECDFTMQHGAADTRVDQASSKSDRPGDVRKNVKQKGFDREMEGERGSVATMERRDVEKAVDGAKMAGRIGGKMAGRTDVLDYSKWDMIDSDESEGKA